MSQPILVLSNPTRPDIDTDDVSDQSNSPGPSSPVNSYSTSLQGQFVGARNVSVQSTFSNSSGLPIRDTPLKTQPNGAGTVNSNAMPFNESIPISLKPASGLPDKRPLSNSVDLTFEERRPSFKQLPRISTTLLPLSPANSDNSVGPNVQVATRTPNVYTTADPGLLMYSSTPALTRANPSLQEFPPIPHLPKRERVGPKLTLNTTMDIDIDGNNSGISSAINTSSSQQPPIPPILRRTASNAPRLSLPPANYRFSLNLVDGYSARMSPSVILRPPPLPLLNLPVLPDTTSSTLDATSSRRSKRAGLMSMPALPRHGTSRGTSGHEQLDDVEDDDEDDDEDQDNSDGVDDDGGPDNTSLEDELDTPQSDSSISETISSRPSHSPSPSHETAHESSTSHDHEDFGGLTTPKKKISKSPFLPPVDMSRIDLSFLDSLPGDKKGKAKLTEDAGRTPTATVWPNRNGVSGIPTALKIMDFGTKTDAWAASPVVPKNSHPNSPSQTPRPGGHFKLPLPVPNTPSSARLTPTRSTTDNYLSVLSRNSISQFPGTYNRASKSLIDVHALEKKEKVEKMVREEEEGAEEERKRRIKAKRMSMRVEAEGDDHKDVDGQSETSPIRMSLTPYWIDPVKASEASSPSSPNTAKQPKKTNNRISMAPAYETIIPLRRRLSMPTFNATSTPPPPYPDLFPNAQSHGVKLTQIQPRDDEGREKLPAYSNSVYIKAIMPRKLEFTQPGVQAKDRKWKRVLCVLEGTSFKVYKPPGVSAIGEWWENKVGVGDISVLPTTNGNSTSWRQTAQGRGAEGTRQSKEVVEMEMERERMRDPMATRPPTQFDDARQRQGSSPTSSFSYPYSNHSGGPVLPATKSALNLAVHLLKPSSRGHARTNSDVGQSSNTPSVPQSSRPSLNIPMNGRSTPTPTIGSTTTIASRSSSPMFAASSSSLLTTPAGSSLFHGSTDSMTSSTGRGARSRMVTNNRTDVSSSTSSTSKGKKKMDDSDFLPDKHSLIKAYTMQEAESGLGSDYVKRKHVIRVRLEGEQFLLQASDVDSVIEWIEVSFSFLSWLSFMLTRFTCRGYKLRQILRWT